MFKKKLNKKIYLICRPKKTNDTNFVRINMRKKQFVRGKMSAEAKRKLIRKQKFKAKFKR